jgi:hypothetical protein
MLSSTNSRISVPSALVLGRELPVRGADLLTTRVDAGVHGVVVAHLLEDLHPSAGHSQLADVVVRLRESVGAARRAAVAQLTSGAKAKGTAIQRLSARIVRPVRDSARSVQVVTIPEPG